MSGLCREQSKSLIADTRADPATAPAPSGKDFLELRSRASWIRPFEARVSRLSSSKGRSIEARYFAAGLLHDQHAGRRVPGIEIELPEAVEAPGRHVAQIERRRARAAHAMGMQRDLVIKVNVRILVPLVAGKTGGQQAFLQLAVFETWIGSPFSCAPLPCSAVNNSSRVGS